MVLHCQIFNGFLSSLWSLFHILPLTEDVSLSLELDFVITSVSSTQICMLSCLFTPLQPVADLLWEEFRDFPEVAWCHFGKGQKLEFVSERLNSSLGIAAVTAPLLMIYLGRHLQKSCLSRGIISILSHFSWICSLLQGLGALEVLLFVSFCHLHKNPCLTAETVSRIIDNNG